MVYNIIFKDFKNGSSQVKKFSNTFNSVDSWFNGAEDKAKRFYARYKKYGYVPEEVRKKFDCGERIRFFEDKKEIEDLAERSLRSSLSRTINNVSDLVRNNDWEWFLTFTCDKEKVDRYDFVQCSKVVRTFFNNFKKRHSPGLQYLLVPEQHQDGAWHFHGLLKNLNVDCLSAAIHTNQYLDNGLINKYYGKQIVKKGKPVYNLDFNYLGFTTVTKIEDLQKSCSYMLKYITKELCSVTKNKRRFYYSQGVEKPVKHKLYLSKDDFRLLQNYLKNICDRKISYEKKIAIDIGSYSSEILLFEYEDNYLSYFILNWYFRDFSNQIFLENEKLLLHGRFEEVSFSHIYDF